MVRNTSRLTDQQREEVVTAIRMRINMIETGDTTFSAADAEAFNKSLTVKRKLLDPKPIAIKVLSDEQRKVINELRSAARALLEQITK